MSFTFVPSSEIKRKASLIIGLSGPSSSGKTYSALLLAQVLAKDKGGKVYGIDTENSRMGDYKNKSLFPNLTPFMHTAMDEPFSSERYLEAVKTAEAAGAGCIVVDSASDEWVGEGGVLDLHETTIQRMSRGDFSKRDKVNFAAWAVAKPPHKKLANALFRLNAHLILCFRAEKKTAMEKVNGKQVFSDQGIQPIIGTALPYIIRFHLVMPERGNGTYEVRKVYGHEQHVFPPGGRIDLKAAKRLIASLGQAPEKPVPEWIFDEETNKYSLTEGDPSAIESKKALYKILLPIFTKGDVDLGKDIYNANHALLEAFPDAGRIKLQETLSKRIPPPEKDPAESW